MLDGEPYSVFGKIRTDDGQEIGSLLLYELDNDYSFWKKCNMVSGDSEVMATQT
jgi:hypothetical protein